MKNITYTISQINLAITLMKNNQYLLTTLFFIFLTTPIIGLSQDNLTHEISCEVHVNYPPLSMTKEALKAADSLIHLNRFYRPSWVKEYLSVEVKTIQNGMEKVAIGVNNLLTHEQKELMSNADFSEDIIIKVSYWPDNTLIDETPKDFSFTMAITPEKNAIFPGGAANLEDYLRENIKDRMENITVGVYQLVAVAFTVDEAGRIVNPHLLHWPSDDERIDDLLLKAVCDMPNWEPAEYPDGTKVKQDFVLVYGDMRSCVTNLLNIRTN